MSRLHANVLAGVLAVCPVSAFGGGVAEPAVDASGSVRQWPDYTLSLGVAYSPAPEVYGRRGGEFVTEKLLDQGVLSLNMDWRPREVGLYGFFFEAAFSRGVLMADTGPRLGAQFRIADRWALYTLASLGLSLAHFNDESPILSSDGMPIRRNYFGGRAGLALGARYRVNKISGLFFEISGSLHALDDGPGGLKNGEFNEPYMARLMLNMGFVFGFAFEGADQDAVLAGGHGQ